MMRAFRTTQPIPAAIPASGTVQNTKIHVPLPWTAFWDHNGAITHELCFFFIYDLEGLGMVFFSFFTLSVLFSFFKRKLLSTVFGNSRLKNEFLLLFCHFLIFVTLWKSLNFPTLQLPLGHWRLKYFFHPQYKIVGKIRGHHIEEV